MKSKRKFSIRDLAKKTGHDRATIARWLDGVTTEADALKVIAEREAAEVKNGANIDRETGLTWFQAKLREDTIQKRRENELAEKVKSREWVPMEWHFGQIKACVNLLEELPTKAGNTLALSAAQVLGLQRMLDDVRRAVADSIK